MVEADLCALALDGVADGPQDELAFAVPLHQVVLHALLEYAEGELFAVFAAQDDDGNSWVRLFDGAYAGFAAGVWQVQVQQHHVELVIVQGLEGIVQPGDVNQVGWRSLRARQTRAQKARVGVVVLYQQKFHRVQWLFPMGASDVHAPSASRLRHRT